MSKYFRYTRVLEMRKTWNEPLIRKPFLFNEDCAEVSAIVGF
jgi:hypothetical protein